MGINYEILGKMDLLIERWKAEDDARYVFLSCYRMMTENMLLSLNTAEFHDPEWIHTLLHHFADYYFDALNCYDCGNNTPLVWEEVYKITKQKELRHVQYLIIGVNAHINYDLVLTLYDLQHKDWSSLNETEQKHRYEDHCKVNEIIANTIDKVQDEILSPKDPWLGVLDHLFGNLDEYLLSQLIISWRQGVWEHSCKFIEAKETIEREALRLNLEEHVISRNKILAFGI